MKSPPGVITDKKYFSFFNGKFVWIVWIKRKRWYNIIVYVVYNKIWGIKNLKLDLENNCIMYEIYPFIYEYNSNLYYE